MVSVDRSQDRYVQVSRQPPVKRSPDPGERTSRWRIEYDYVVTARDDLFPQRFPGPAATPTQSHSDVGRDGGLGLLQQVRAVSVYRFLNLLGGFAWCDRSAPGDRRGLRNWCEKRQSSMAHSGQRYSAVYATGGRRPVIDHDDEASHVTSVRSGETLRIPNDRG